MRKFLVVLLSLFILTGCGVDDKQVVFESSVDNRTSDISETKKEKPKSEWGKIDSENNKKTEVDAGISIETLWGLIKDKKNGNLVVNDIKAIRGFDERYLEDTNLSILKEKRKGGEYVLYDLKTINKMIKYASHVKYVNSEKEKFIEDSLSVLISDSSVMLETSDLQKIHRLEKYIVRNFKYDNDYLKGERTKYSKYQDNYGANLYYILKTRKGICSDFTVLYKRLCDRLGIECWIELGGTSKWGIRSHAWNVIEVEGVKYYKDITVDTQNKDLFWCQKASIYDFLKQHKVMSIISSEE